MIERVLPDSRDRAAGSASSRFGMDAMHWVERFLSEATLPLVGLVVFAGLVAAMHLGTTLARRTVDRETADPSPDPHGEAYIVSGAFGLMALLLGFTFSLAIDRFDHRRSLTLEEANAIGTTYLRVQMLESPARSLLSDLLTHYAANRLELAKATDGQARVRLMAESDSLQIRLWRATIRSVRASGNETISRPLIESMNATIDAGAARVAARRAHVPPRVLATLLLYMTISAFVLGFEGSGSRWKPAPVVLLGLFALAFLLTIDIDRPNGGSIREPQQPMEDLVTMMRANPTESF
jgi:hypothetical protein